LVSLSAAAAPPALAAAAGIGRGFAGGGAAIRNGTRIYVT
jgi:hypothetical protein